MKLKPILKPDAPPHKGNMVVMKHVFFLFFLTLSSFSSGGSTATSFSYVGAPYLYTVPTDHNELEVFLWGAGGGSATHTGLHAAWG